LPFVVLRKERHFPPKANNFSLVVMEVVLAKELAALVISFFLGPLKRPPMYGPATLYPKRKTAGISVAAAAVIEIEKASALLFMPVLKNNKSKIFLNIFMIIFHSWQRARDSLSLFLPFF